MRKRLTQCMGPLTSSPIRTRRLSNRRDTQMPKSPPAAGESLRSYCLRSLPPDGPIRALRDVLHLAERQMPAWEDVQALSSLLEIDLNWAKDHFCGHSRGNKGVWRVG